MRHSRLAIASCFVLASHPALIAQEITRISAPAIGQTFTIDYTSTANNVFVMFAALNSNGSLNVPGIGNTFRLELAHLFTMYGGVVPASGVHVQSFPTPNEQALVGGCLSIQAFDGGAPTPYNFSKNAVDLCVSNGIGTILLAEGLDTSFMLGDLDLESVKNATAGRPVTLGLGKVAVQPITHFGREGWLPLVVPTALSNTSNFQADQHVDSGKAVARDCREPSTQNIKLPNGFDLYVCRNNANQKEFFLLSIERKTSSARELSGSRVLDAGTSAQPDSDYLSGFGFTPDGEVAVALVHDSTNAPTPNVGPGDRVFLIYTNPAKTWSNGKNVIDVSPAAGPNKLHTGYNNSLRVGNGWGFVEGEEPSGTAGGAALWGGKLDGTPWSRLPVPQTGTGRSFYWSYREWRQTPDGSAGFFMIGGDPASNMTHMDCIAITNVSPTTTPTVTNITGFTTATQLRTPGTTGTTQGPIRAAITPDGKYAAVLIGANNAPGTGIAIVKTDGSNAGSVTAFTAADFDPQVDTFLSLHWLNDTALLFVAGSEAQSYFDFYVRDISGTPRTINLTRTTTGSKVPPFTQGGDTGNVILLGLLSSDNRKYFYFIRAVRGGPPFQNLVGIDASTLALIDITGSEFSSGTSSNLRAGPNLGTSQFRRHPTTNEMFFVAGKADSSSTTYDDNIWRFDPETASPAVQVTANSGSGAVANIQRIGDLTLDPLGIYVAWAQGKGTAVADPENLFIQVWVAGTPIQISKSPPAGIQQGIRSGSIHFSPPPTPGICWVQGTGSRSTPSADAVALWSLLLPDKAPLRLSGAPAATTKHFLPLNCGK